MAARAPLHEMQSNTVVPPPGLTAEQQRGWDLVMREHRNVFVSGRAGCGKSFLVHHLVRALRRQHTPSTVFVTATTGVAACNIHGTTVHSFAGIGLGREDAAQLLAAMRPPAIKRWCAATVWVIDEISMLNAALLEKLNTIAQTLRGNTAPMGGIRVIAVGDFFQLPPVPDRGTRTEEVQFAFESPVWKALFPSQCLIDLRTQMRQKDDPMLERLLNNIRVGNVPADAEQVFAAAGSGLEALRTQGLKPTKLFATKKQVAAVNRAELARLDGASVILHAIDAGSRSGIAQLHKHGRFVQTLELKVGAQVMLLYNLETKQGLVNGTLGTVVRFDGPAHSPIPVVLFHTRHGTREVIMKREVWEILSGDMVIASRTQYPLRLAYALTIHKSQGMTLPAMVVDMHRIFSAGQAYVALSRGTSLATMGVHHFTPSAVHSDLRVLHFYHDAAKQREKYIADTNKRAVEGEDGGGAAVGSSPPTKRLRTATAT